MAGKASNAALLKQMKEHFPDRWDVARIDSRVEGRRVSGAIKIHCREDDKVFLSDFTAKLDAKGKLTDLTLDGVHVGKFIGRLHHS